jgi:hypothetical protein
LDGQTLEEKHIKGKHQMEDKPSGRGKQQKKK